jgi:hypothetical protein
MAIAPKYIIRKNKAKNSFSNKNNKIEADKKLVIKAKTECNGFLYKITKTELKVSNPEKKIINKSDIFNVKRI